MNAIDLLFKTSRFNLSKVAEHFINPCCFGEDLAAWLKEKSVEKGVQLAAPGQEDRGWYLRANFGTEGYFLGISGNAEGNSSNADDGDWRIIVKKNRTVWRRLSGSGNIATDDPLVLLVEQILRGEADFREIRRENGPSW